MRAGTDEALRSSGPGESVLSHFGAVPACGSQPGWQSGRAGSSGLPPGLGPLPRESGVVETGAGRCSGTLNLHECFPKVFAEFELWEGCPAQLSTMGFPPDGAVPEDGAIAATWSLL